MVYTVKQYNKLCIAAHCDPYMPLSLITMIGILVYLPLYADNKNGRRDVAKDDRRS